MCAKVVHFSWQGARLATPPSLWRLPERPARGAAPLGCGYQVGGEVHEVRVVLVDELHHGGFEQPVVELQVLPQLLQLHAPPAVGHESVDVEVVLGIDAEKQKLLQ